MTQNHCQSVVSEISQTYSESGPIKPSFAFSWDKYWSTHVALVHSESDKFIARSLIIFPPPFPDSEGDNKPFSVPFGDMNFIAKFIIDSEGADSDEDRRVMGIAVKNIWGPGSGAKELSGEDKENAEVWFDRVEGL